MVSTKDLALVGGIGLIAFIILKGGRDLFDALPTLGSGIEEAGQGILNFGGQAGTGIKDFFNINRESRESPLVIVDPVPNVITGEFLDPVQGDVPLQADEIPIVIDTDNPINIGNPDGILIRDPRSPSPIGASSVEELLAIITARDSNIETIPDIDTSIPSPFDNQQFQGGGTGFIGGQINEIPIDRLSLGDIVDRFNVTASQAADIRARAQDDFGNFDFGSNIGLGIGSVVAEDPSIFNNLPNLGQVSSPEFEGLSAQEIAQRLTGGNISNF